MTRVVGLLAITLVLVALCELAARDNVRASRRQAGAAWAAIGAGGGLVGPG